MPLIRSICVAYDATCGICTRVKDWLRRQTPLVALEFVATGSAEARRRFPQLPPGELAVIADTGEVWLGNHAWIVCLWALRDYREWAVRLSRPGLSLLAREAFSLISNNRARLSGMLRLRSDPELEQQLRKVMVPKCEVEQKPTGV
jgi:predicted DCC family thiol-disulfide oxidoreductase YuxK